MLLYCAVQSKVTMIERCYNSVPRLQCSSKGNAAASLDVVEQLWSFRLLTCLLRGLLIQVLQGDKLRGSERMLSWVSGQGKLSIDILWNKWKNCETVKRDRGTSSGSHIFPNQRNVTPKCSSVKMRRSFGDMTSVQLKLHGSSLLVAASVSSELGKAVLYLLRYRYTGFKLCELDLFWKFIPESDRLILGLMMK